MQTKQRGGLTETAENAVAVSASGAPPGAVVVTMVTPTAKEPMAALKSAAVTQGGSIAARSLAVQLPQKLVVARQRRGQPSSLLLDGSKFFIDTSQACFGLIGDPRQRLLRHPTHS